MCSGFDCVNDESFGSNALVLKENNTRIRFVDNSADKVLSESWELQANDSINGGKSYFQFQVRSEEQGSILLSDGTNPLLDCSTESLFMPGYYVCIQIGLTPVGEPVLVQGDPTIMDDRIPAPLYIQRPVAYFGTESEGSIALGADSEVVAAAVSVGKAGLERKIVNVAKAIANTDLATVADINVVSSNLDEIDARLDEIESAISAMESSELFNTTSGATTPLTLALLFTILLYRLTRHKFNGSL